MDQNQIDNQILAQWLKKKASKFGFWHRRFCVLTNKEIIIYKKEKKDLVHRIKITPDLQTQLVNEGSTLTLIIRSSGNKPITFSADEGEPILNWAQQIRKITLMTPNMTINDFEVLSIIARGFYGKVLLAKKKDTGEFYAIKEIHKSRLIRSSQVHSLFMERNILVKTHHPFIANLLYAFQSDTKVYFVLEYASGGELFYQIQQRGKIPEKEVKMYIAELAMALNYLHNNNIIYRDLKPENVLLDSQGYAKLTDFGLAKILNVQDSASTFCGTSEYIAPEILNKKSYGIEIDWWALGVLTYELIFGNLPFSNPNKVLLFESIKNDEPKFPPNVDPKIKQFITMLLKKNPEQRGSFKDVFNHPFFDGLNFEDVYMKKIQPEFVPVAPGSVQQTKYDDEPPVDNPLDSLTTPIDSITNAQFQGFSYAGFNDDGDDDSSDVKVEDSDDDNNDSSLKPTSLFDLPQV